jgi:hypothetical protein
MAKVIIRIDEGVLTSVKTDSEDQLEVELFDFDELSDECPTEREYKKATKGMKEIG